MCGAYRYASLAALRFSVCNFTHGLRRGLYSCAALRLPTASQPQQHQLFIHVGVA
jgi:hypothetical protein